MPGERVKKISYKDSGVDVEKGDAFIRTIKPMVESTFRPEVLTKIGGFAGCFSLNLERYKKPILVSSTDGVGTKLLLADFLRVYDTVGIDLVAMSVDDVIVTGAEPLFFLDYIACGRLNKIMLAQVMKGIVRGCREARCALIGGETAELPGLYAPRQWDLAGFCVGIVDRAKIIDGRRCRPGDKVIGLASSGLHSNGFSLARRAFSAKELKGLIGRELLKPTRIYTAAILSVLPKVEIKALAHITGGGFIDNIPRVVPLGLGVRIRRGTWPVPEIFRVIQERGGVPEREMVRTLNMGIGMIVVVAAKDAERTIALFRRAKQRAYAIGEIVRGSHEVTMV